MNVWEIPLQVAGIVLGVFVLAIVVLALRDAARGVRTRIGR